jgi:hypothetical protein
MSNPVFNPNTFDTSSDDFSFSEALQVSENSHTSQRNQSSHMTDEMMPVEPTVTAGTSQCGRVCTMSQRMAESVSQQIPMETKVCTTWHLKLLMAIRMKTFSMTPIFYFKSV